MKKFITLCLSLTLLTALHAQDDVTARFKYEEAEEAYNTGDYKASLDKLDEVDKLLGGKTNPKTLYLRIMAQNKLLGDDGSSNMHLLQSLKANIAQYLTAYSSQPSLEDKLRAVYQVNEERKDYSNNADFYTGFAALEAKDTAAALTSFTRGAVAGDGQSMIYLGIINEDGYRLSKPDYRKALEWYGKAADKGNSFAMMNIADIYADRYADGQRGLKDTVKAMEWYIRAADKGNIFAIFRIGHMYVTGEGAPRDDARAIEWYTKAVDKGYLPAMSQLAYIYEYGNEIVKDMSKALEWLTKAADKGDASSMYRIGTYYEQLVPPDYAKAMEWYLKADAKGDRSAAFSLGSIYRYGNGVAVDYSKAIEWYKKDAANGGRTAMRNISELYKEGGHGIVKDEKLATEWLERSKAAGDQPIK